MLIHEAAAVLNLHAQAVAVQNICSLVPVVLDVAAGNYTRWREQFLLTVGKFALQDHVLLDDPPVAYPDWTRMDCVVRSWIYETIPNDLVETVMTPNAAARTVWTAVESQFLDNRETRALLLDAQFRGFKQGDLSITDYCRRLKTMADQLGNLGEPVSDRTLVLNVIRGLNAKYTAIGRHIRRGRPFPTFLEAKNDLLLEEINMGASDVDPSTALFAAGHGASSAPSQQRPPGGSEGRSSSGSGGGASSKTRRSGKRNNRQPKSGGGNGGTSASGSGGCPAGCGQRHNPVAQLPQSVDRRHPDVALPSTAAGPPAAPQALLAQQAQQAQQAQLQ